jgi:hypothetical protein
MDKQSPGPYRTNLTKALSAEPGIVQEAMFWIGNEESQNGTAKPPIVNGRMEPP